MTEPTHASAPSPAAQPEPTKPKHDPGTSGFWWVPGGMLLTAAAAILAWWVWPPNQDVRDLDEVKAAVDGEAPLPEYVLETDGGIESEGAPDRSGRHRYRRATEFEWILRPKLESEGEVDGNVGVRGFAFVDGSSAGLVLGALDGLVKIAKSGEIQIMGTVEQLDLEPGLYTVTLAVGRPANLPNDAGQVHESGADAAWQVRRIDVEITN